MCDDDSIRLVRRHTYGKCDASVVRRFYELYPKGLGQENQIKEDGLPLHRCLVLFSESCDIALFKWMAHQYPDALLYQDRLGFTPIHKACLALSLDSTDNKAEFCRFLASECPESVRVVASSGLLPIHFLTKRSNRPAVQKILLALLRQYPQSIGASAHNSRVDPTPQSVPFLARVYPLLEEERLLKDDVPYLTGLADAWHEASGVSKDGLQVSVPQVFQKWVTLRTESFTEQRLEQLSERIMEACREFEGEDVDDDDDDEHEEGEREEFEFEMDGDDFMQNLMDGDDLEEGEEEEFEFGMDDDDLEEGEEDEFEL